MRKIIVISTIFILIMASLSGIYLLSRINEENNSNEDENHNKNIFIPPTGIRRDPIIEYDSGSNPSENKPWPMFQHDLQHTSFVNAVGTGDIDSYGLLYHRWDDTFSQPVVADFNNDGMHEILVYSERFNGIALYSYNGDLIWQRDLDSDVWATPAIADINDDQRLEIVVGLRGGSAIFTFDENGELLWSFPVSGYVHSSPSVADINNDGKMDIVFSSDPVFDISSVYAISTQDNMPYLLWKLDVDYDKSTSLVSSPALVDITGDGTLETIIGSYNNYLYTIDSQGKVLWKFQMEGEEDDGEDGIYCSPVIADLDGDGSLEIIFATIDKKRSIDNRIYCLDIEGNKLWDFVVGSEVSGSPSVADINNDGWLEILFGSWNSFMYVLNTEGNELWTYDLGYPTSSSPSIADLDGDGTLEIMMASKPRGEVEKPQSNLMILNNSGTLLWKHVLDGKTWTSPPVVDLNGDGTLEILIGVYVGDDGADYGLYVFGDMSNNNLHDNLPDLAIHNWTVEISHPNFVQTKSTVLVRNIGLVNISNVNVNFETSLKDVGNLTIETISALSEVEVELTWNGNDDEVIVTVDPDDIIAESDENNNMGIKTA